jgi:hypothetical protein
MEIPVRVRPCYWLLPTGEKGWVTLELDRPQRVSRIRILNTQHQGQNDRGATHYRVTVRTADGRERRIATRTFGEPVPPSKFTGKTYPGGWGNTYADDTPVAPYAGWHDIAIDVREPVAAVTVHVDAFWGRGGGLNEIQVLGR